MQNAANDGLDKALVARAFRPAGKIEPAAIDSAPSIAPAGPNTAAIGGNPAAV